MEQKRKQMKQRAQEAPMASSSSLATSCKSHDVFLSFDDETRHTFSAHLCGNLRGKGIATFMEEDEDPRRGGQINPSVVDAINGSSFVIVVLTRNYVMSPRCLDELVIVVECLDLIGNMMIPVFYRVEPMELRDGGGDFGRAMEKLEEKFKDNPEKVQKWRAALLRASIIFGWKFDSGYESEIVERIAQDISRRVCRTPLFADEFPVGMDSIINQLKLVLGNPPSETFVIGLCGINRTAKTTIAKACYNSMFGSFEGSSFLANVSATSKQYNGLVKLQEALLNEIIGGGDNIRVVGVSRGINLIRERLCSKRILLVLDDVDHIGQLEALAGSRDWFGPGSQVVITTRDERLLVVHGVDRRYMMDELYDNSINAFGHLESPHNEVLEMYKENYDALGDHEKAVLLDITCFFRGENRDHVVKMLRNCNLYPDIGISVLIDKSLIHIIKGNKLQMNDMVQQMGRDIVSKESTNPGERTRLWSHEDVLQVLEENTGTHEIEGIVIDLPEPNTRVLDADAFANMKRLRLLSIKSACFSSRPIRLPNELKWLEWNRYPALSLPSDFRPKKLTVLKLRSSLIKQLWEGFKMCSNLAIVELTNCNSLCEIPDASAVPNLEILIVNHCTSLVTVHESVGHLEKLTIISIEGCSNLRIIPLRLNLVSLEILNFSCCSNLHTFPDISARMELVESVDFSNTAVTELPSSIQNLTGLRYLNLEYCRNLKALPSNIHSMPKIKELHLKGCTSLQGFPTQKSSLSDHKPGFLMLESLDMSRCGISNLSFLEAIDCFKELQYLNMSRNDFFTLPLCISQLSKLNILHLEECTHLREILKLPPSLKYLNAKGCASLESLDMRNVQSAATLKLDFTNCYKLSESKRWLHKEYFGDKDFQVIVPGSSIPNWLSHQSSDGSMILKVEKPLLEEGIGLVVSTVFCSKDRVPLIVKCIVFINGEAVVSSVCDLDGSLELDHIWLGYFPLSIRENVIQGDRNQVEVSFKFQKTNSKESLMMNASMFGVQILRDKDKEDGSSERASNISVDSMEDAHFTGMKYANHILLQSSKCQDIPNAPTSEQNCSFAGNNISISGNLRPLKQKQQPCFHECRKLQVGLGSKLTLSKIRKRNCEATTQK